MRSVGRPVMGPRRGWREARVCVCVNCIGSCWRGAPGERSLLGGLEHSRARLVMASGPFPARRERLHQRQRNHCKQKPQPERDSRKNDVVDGVLARGDTLTLVRLGKANKVNKAVPHPSWKCGEKRRSGWPDLACASATAKHLHHVGRTVAGGG